MRINCCGCRHRKQRNDNQELAKVACPKNDKEHDNSKKASLQPVLNGGQLNTERLSLPDVVIHSTHLLGINPIESQRPSLQIDVETGRRPTLDVETTARLAEAESVYLDDPTSISKSSILLTRDPMDQTTRSFSLGTSITSDHWKLSFNPSNVSSHSPSLSIPTTDRRKSSFVRLLSLRSLKKQLGKRDILKSASNKRASYDSSKFNKATKQLHKKGCIEHPTEEDEDQDGSTDKLGQLPSSKLNRCKELKFPNSESRLKEFTPYFGRTPNRNAAALRRGSLCIFSHVDEPIVTPFAQILASLRRVRTNFIILTNITSSKDLRFGTSHTGDEAQNMVSMQEEQLKVSASETLEELEWCLERLENIQTHRSVSDMATSKFRKMLNKELSQFKDGSQNAKQISEYICSTFLDANEVDPSTVTTQMADLTTTDSAPYESPKLAASGELRCGLTVAQTSEFPSSSKSNEDINSDGLKPGVENQRNLGGSTESFLTSDKSSTETSVGLLPPGIKSAQMERLKEFIVNGLDQWGVDIFELSQLTPNPLTCLFYAIFQKRGLIKRFNIPEMNLIRYANLIEEKYNDVPYHNRVHAADVLQSAHVLLNASALMSVFTDLEVLAVLFACAIHDVDHPGLTNQFLINTNNELAILYNDTSVLENHHLAVGFQLLTRPGCDILENVPRKQRLSLRRMVIDMVLATDMSKHMSLLADLKTMVETKKVAGSGILTLDNYSDRMQILQSMIHCADLSNPTKSLDLYRQWNARVMEEHFRQGDRERERGLDLSPMCDRTTASIEKTQVSFIDYIVHPLWETWSDLVHPDALKILDTLDENREWYLNQISNETVSEDPEPQDENH